VSPATLISSHRTIQAIDFSAVTTEELKSFDIDFVFKIDRTGKTADDASYPLRAQCLLTVVAGTVHTTSDVSCSLLLAV
jgi:hypothetical protein